MTNNHHCYYRLFKILMNPKTSHFSEFCSKLLKQEETDIHSIENEFAQLKNGIKINEFLERVLVHCEKTIIKYHGNLGNRIKKFKQYLDHPIAQEHNTIMDIFKDDQASLEEINDELQSLNFFVQKDANQELNEYKILNQLAQEFYLDYHQLLEYLINIDSKPYSLLEFFDKQLQKREFIYKFMLQYAKQKIISYEYCQILGTSLKKVISKLKSQIEFKISLSRTHNHKLLQSQIRFYKVFEQILEIAGQIISYFVDPIQDQYRVYMLMVLQLQPIVNQKHYHSNLIKNMARQLGETIQLNLLKDLKTNQVLFQSIEQVEKKVKKLGMRMESQLKQMVSQMNSESKELQNILREAEQEWEQMLAEQHQLYHAQSQSFKGALAKRKEQFMNNKDFYCFDPLFHKHQIRLGLTAKEIYKLIFDDSDNCFFSQYKKNSILQIELQMDKLTPRPPSFYDSEDCYDMRSLVEMKSGCQRRMSFKHPIKERLFYFVPEYASCKQQDEITFITDKEFIHQSEVFLHGFPYADYFSVQNYFYVCEDNSKNSMLMQVLMRSMARFGYKNNILKKTWLEPIFHKKAKDENDLVWNSLLKPLIERTVEEYASQQREVKQRERKDNYVQKYKIKKLINQQIDLKNVAVKKDQLDQQREHPVRPPPQVQQQSQQRPSKTVVRFKIQDVLTLALFLVCIVLQLVNIYLMTP